MHLRPLLLLALAAAPAFLHAENWPAWRGPRGDGTSHETALPLTWSATEGIRWKIALPERGNSTPVIWGDRVFLTQPVGTRRTLMCLDRKDGRTLWQHGPTFAGKDPTHGTNPYCAPSPATDGERIIAWFGSAGAWCWDFAGKELWHTDLGTQEHIWGYAASPVLHGDLVILNFGPGPRSFIVALDKRTGKEAWRFDVPAPDIVEGPGDPAKDFIGSWNTGFVGQIGGRAEYLVSLPGALWSLDPLTGKPHWHCNGLNPLSYADPLAGDGAIAAFGGYGGYSIGLRPGGTGDITATHRLWQRKTNPQRIGSGVTRGTHAWITSEPGVIECIDLTTGTERWKKRLDAPGGRAASWSSLLLAGDHIYALTQACHTIVFRASPEKYEPLASNPLGDAHTNSSPAASDGQLFLPHLDLPLVHRQITPARRKPPTARPTPQPEHTP